MKITVKGYQKITSKKSGEVFYLVHGLYEEDYVTGSAVDRFIFPASLFDMPTHYDTCLALSVPCVLNVEYNKNARIINVQEEENSL